MKGPLNPELKIDDVIMLLHMEGETGVPPGTIGVVTKITKDPFEDDGSNIISVKWENGSTLSIVTSTDAWKKVQNDTIKEQRTDVHTWNYITQNADVFENFDWRWLEKFLYKVRESGVVNMFGAHPLLYAGKTHIDRYHGEGREDDESFQALLDDADEAKDKIIQGVISYMEKNNKRLARHFSQKILGLYMALSGIRHQN